MLDEPLVVVSVVVVDEPELVPLVSVPEALEPVPLVVPELVPEVVPELVPLAPVVPMVEPVLLVVPELVVPVVPLVELGLLVSVPGPGLVLPLLVVPVPLVPVPVAPVPVLPVLDEPAPVLELPPADDCAYEKPAAASRDAVAAAMARPFEIWFMV